MRSTAAVLVAVGCSQPAQTADRQRPRLRHHAPVATTTAPPPPHRRAAATSAQPTTTQTPVHTHLALPPAGQRRPPLPRRSRRQALPRPGRRRLGGLRRPHPRRVAELPRRSPSPRLQHGPGPDDESGQVQPVVERAGGGRRRWSPSLPQERRRRNVGRRSDLRGRRRTAQPSPRQLRRRLLITEPGLLRLDRPAPERGQRAQHAGRADRLLLRLRQRRAGRLVAHDEQRANTQAVQLRLRPVPREQVQERPQHRLGGRRRHAAAGRVRGRRRGRTRCLEGIKAAG